MSQPTDRARSAELIAASVLFRPTQPDNEVQLFDLNVDAGFTGGTVQGIHPVLRHDSLIDACKLVGEWSPTHPDYATGQDYKVGMIVTQDSKTYRCIEDITGSPVAFDSSKWSETNDYTEWLRERRSEAAARTLRDWLAGDPTQKPATLAPRTFVVGKTPYQETFNGSVESSGYYIDTPFDGPELSISQVRLFGFGESAVQVHLQDIANRSADLSVSVDLPDGTEPAMSVAPVDWLLKPGRRYLLAVDSPVDGTMWDIAKNVDVPSEAFVLSEFSSYNSVATGGRFRTVDNLVSNFAPVGFDVLATCPVMPLVEPCAAVLAEACMYRLGMDLLRWVAFSERQNKRTGIIDRAELIREIEGDRENPRLAAEYSRTLRAVQPSLSVLPAQCRPKKLSRGVTYTYR